MGAAKSFAQYLADAAARTPEESAAQGEASWKNLVETPAATSDLTRAKQIIAAGMEHNSMRFAMALAFHSSMPADLARKHIAWGAGAPSEGWKPF